MRATKLLNYCFTIRIQFVGPHFTFVFKHVFHSTLLVKHFETMKATKLLAYCFIIHIRFVVSQITFVFKRVSLYALSEIFWNNGSNKTLDSLCHNSIHFVVSQFMFPLNKCFTVRSLWNILQTTGRNKTLGSLFHNSY